MRRATRAGQLRRVQGRADRLHQGAGPGSRLARDYGQRRGAGNDRHGHDQGDFEGAHEDWAKKIPVQRLGTPEDIAAAVRFLASDEAAYITGHVLAVNGGMHTVGG